MSMRPSCLFPNLVILKWNPQGSTPHLPIVFIQRLLSPALVSLKVSLAGADEATALSLFDNYLLLCPHLKSVDFWFPGHSPSATTIQALSRAICRQNTLEDVAIYAPMDDIALRHLVMLPTLKVLNVVLSSKLRPQIHSFLPTDALFRNVKELVFETSHIDLVTSLLRPRDQTFHTFHLCNRVRLTSAATLAMFEILASRPRTQPLRELSISPGDLCHPLRLDQMESEASRHCLSYEILQPLMVFGSLHDLTIEWSEQISLDDNEVANLARSWPMLRSFQFNCGRGGYPPFETKYPTLRGLFSLLTSCPELQMVRLSIDARRVPEFKDVEPCKTNLDFINVSESPIDEAFPVAEFLFKYIPGVTALGTGCSRAPGTNEAQILAYNRAWEQAEEHLMEFHGIDRRD